MDRRSFVASLGMMASAAMAVSMVPLSTVHAVVTPASDEGWHVDDICGHWPRYAHPIGYAHVQSVHVSLLALADPIDHIFLA
jgi:hypothetical protein